MSEPNRTERSECNEQRLNECVVEDGLDTFQGAEVSGRGRYFPQPTWPPSRPTHPFHPAHFQTNDNFFPQTNQFTSVLGPTLQYDYNSFLNAAGTGTANNAVTTTNGNNVSHGANNSSSRNGVIAAPTTTGHPLPHHNHFPRRGIGPAPLRAHATAAARLPQDVYTPRYLDSVFIPAPAPPAAPPSAYLPHGMHPQHQPHPLPQHHQPSAMGHRMPIPGPIAQQQKQELTIGIPALDDLDNQRAYPMQNFDDVSLEMLPLGLQTTASRRPSTGDFSEGASTATISSMKLPIEGADYSVNSGPSSESGGNGGDNNGTGGGGMSENEDDKELTTNPESFESSDSEEPVGTAPIFHPLPSMFSSLPRPLSFPMTNASKELPTLALFSSCNLESRVVTDYADSHQELSLMLALPGLSTHQAPLLSLQQAGDILQAINNPLVVLKVGRLTRKLVPNPAILRPTEDVGTLALWLSPTSDVRLFWHSFLKGPSSEAARDLEEQIAQIRYVGEGSPYRELFSHVELSEELAWVAAESDQTDGGTGIRLEMIDHDPSGRSFKLTRKKSHDRQKTELATKLENEEKKTGREALPDENQKLRQLLANCMSEDSEEEDTFFFWIAESSLSEGMQMLNTMQNRLDHLPTLAGVSGVPEKKLQELFDWFSKGQEAASNNTNSALSHEIAAWIDLSAGASVPSQLFSNTCPANVPNWAEAVEDIQAVSSSAATAGTSASTSSNPVVEEDHLPVENTIREGCALSATANFLVADKKWGLTHLATASVMVAVGVESTGFFYDEEKAHKDASHCAHELAKKRAEAGASAEAERLGRIRLEELVAVKSRKEMRSHKAVCSGTSTVGEGRSMDTNVSSSLPSSSPQQTSHQPTHTSSSPSSQPLNGGGGGHPRPVTPQNACNASLQGETMHHRTGNGNLNASSIAGASSSSSSSSNNMNHRIFSMQRYLNTDQVPNAIGQSVQGNSFLHNSLAHQYYPNMGSNMDDCFRQYVHYGVPLDQGSYQSWSHYHGEAGNTQVIGQMPQYEHFCGWTPPRMPGYPTAPSQHHHWPYGGQTSTIRQVRQAQIYPQQRHQFDPMTANIYPRHLPPALPFMQMNQLHGMRSPKYPNMTLVRLAQEAKEKVTRRPRERVRLAPSGSNLAASNIPFESDPHAESIAWHNPTHQLDAFYRNPLNVTCKQEPNETNNESRTCAETPRKTTADDGDHM